MPTPLHTAGPNGLHVGMGQVFMSRDIRLVIVDDIEETRTNISRLLTFVDDAVLVGEAGDGSEALTVCRRVRPDCVLLDVNMPKMGGFEAAAILRREMPNVRVIMMSVDDSPTYRRQAFVAGAIDFLLKPLSIDDITKTLTSISQAKVSV